MKITMTMELPVEVNKDGKYYVSCCPILDVCSQGTTKKKAKDNLVEAIILFMISCFERGTLDQVMKDCGFKPFHKARPKTSVIPRKYDTIKVPFPFQVPAEAPRHCHA